MDQSTSTIAVNLEIPADIRQEDVWTFNKQLEQVDGIETDLQPAKDLVGITLLVIHVASQIMPHVPVIVGNIKAIHDVAKIIHDFTQQQSSRHQEGGNKIHSITMHTNRGTKVTISNLTVEEIERLLQER